MWSLSTDKFGRRTIVNSCQTLVVVILFAVGAMYWTGATTGNKKAGAALVSGETSSAFPSLLMTMMKLTGKQNL